MGEAAPDFADRFEEAIVDDGFDLGRIRRSAADLLRDQMDDTVGPVFDHLHGYLAFAAHLNRMCATKWRPSRRQGHRIDVLLELHSHALLVADEILALLRTGFIIAAEARWRTLYELRIVAGVIEQSPENTARRYKCDHIAEQHRRLRRPEMQRYLRDGGAEADAYRNDVEKKYRRVAAIHGESIGRTYGWAAEVIPLKRITFADLVREVTDGQDDSWPRYVNASHHIHGERMSSMKALRVEDAAHGPVFAPGPADTFPVLMDTTQNLNSITSSMAGAHFEVYENRLAYYLSYVCGMVSLDVQTEAFRAWRQVDAGYLNRRLGIFV